MSDKKIGLYSMGLHEHGFLTANGTDYKILRVPGGWIYHDTSVNGQQVFVPYSEEFKE